MKSDFNERRENRKARYEELAEKNRQNAEQRYKAAKQTSDQIPMGQPILVGHHSESSHRAALKRIDNNVRKSIEHDQKAGYYEDRVASIEQNRAIYSDDPEAIVKLKHQLLELQGGQDKMKAINRIVRSKKLSDEQITEKLKAAYGYPASLIHELLHPQYSYQKRGFQSWRLSNNNANIRRIKQRIEQLERGENEQTTERHIGQVTILDSVEHNRLQLFFSGKPSVAIRDRLKARGFRWSRSEMAWQRHRSSEATYQAEQIIAMYNAEINQ